MRMQSCMAMLGSLCPSHVAADDMGIKTIYTSRRCLLGVLLRY